MSKSFLAEPEAVGERLTENAAMSAREERGEPNVTRPRVVSQRWFDSPPPRVCREFFNKILTPSGMATCAGCARFGD